MLDSRVDPAPGPRPGAFALYDPRLGPLYGHYWPPAGLMNEHHLA